MLPRGLDGGTVRTPARQVPRAPAGGNQPIRGVDGRIATDAREAPGRCTRPREASRPRRDGCDLHRGAPGAPLSGMRLRLVAADTVPEDLSIERLRVDLEQGGRLGAVAADALERGDDVRALHLLEATADRSFRGSRFPLQLTGQVLGLDHL